MAALNDPPGDSGRGGGRRRSSAERKRPSVRRPLSTSTRGNANPDFDPKICRYLGVELSRGEESSSSRQREHLREDHGQRPREGRVHRPPYREPVDVELFDHDRRLQAGERGRIHASSRSTATRSVGQRRIQPRVPITARPDRHDHRRRERDRSSPSGPLHQGQIQASSISPSTS